MTANIATSLVISALAALSVTSPAVGQAPGPGSRVAVLEAPLALRLEHKSLNEALKRALEDKEGVGDAARAIDALLSSHFTHEEELALRPLGLLRGVAQDASSADVASAIAMTVRLEQNLPQLLDEHRAILEASKRLGDVARRERKPQFLDLTDRLWLHTRVAEEVLYPASILLGEHLRLRQEAKRTRGVLTAAPAPARMPAASLPGASPVSGAAVFKTYCATCHGESGRGNGAVAIFLRRRPADLTQIAHRNKGTFPAEQVYQMIDGRQALKLHGESQMPVWGDAFATTATESDERAIKAKIDALVAYLASIQERPAR